MNVFKKGIKVTALISVLSIVITGCAGGGSDGNSSPKSPIPSASEISLPYFTVLPLFASNFTGFVPLGNLNPSGHTFPTDHHYFYLANPATKYDVYAPGHFWITQITASEHVSDGFTDYRLKFNPCLEVYGILDHMSSLSGSLLSQLGKFTEQECQSYTNGGKDYRQCTKNVMIEISAGTVIGEAGGNAGQNALDFGVYDTGFPQALANPSRFYNQGQKYLYAVSAIDYFSAALQTQLRSRASNYSGTIHRTVEPIGGTIVNDVPGTAQGIWFKQGEPTLPEDPHIALVFDNVDPTQPRFSIGTSQTGLSSGVYAFTDVSSGYTNRKFSQVTADGNIYTYHNLQNTIPNTVILIQLLDNSTLRVEKQMEAQGPPWAFTNNAVIYVR